MPGITIEQALGEITTLVFDLSANFVFTRYNYSEYDIDTYAGFRIETRHYFNMYQRARDNKNIRYFSGPYIGIGGQYIYSPKFEEGWLDTGLILGFQNTFGKFFFRFGG